MNNNISFTKKQKDIQGKQELLLVSLGKFYDDPKNKKNLVNILEGKDKISLRIIDWFVTNYSKKKNVEYTLKIKNTSPKRSATLKKKTNVNKNSKKDLSKYTSSHKQLNVFLSYKSQLRAYSKRQFDPFCRRNRINFYFNETEFITTTVGQLNFFRWALQNNVIDYIMVNYKEIEFDMNENTKKSKLEKLSLQSKELNNNSLNRKDSSEDNDELSTTSNEHSDDTNDIQSIIKTTIKKRKKRKPLSVAATNNMNKNNHPVLVSFD